jgi:hypothetical protein
MIPVHRAGFLKGANFEDCLRAGRTATHGYKRFYLPMKDVQA